MATLADVFQALNTLKKEGIIQKYAVAGGMAFLFYTEPVRTYDLDVFVFLPPQASAIFSMEPLYAKLRKRGYSFDAEHVLIHDTPVQFLPIYNSLAEEAVEQAIVQEYEGVWVPVVTAEHLAALAYQTGGRRRLERTEEHLRWPQFDHQKLKDILVRHKIPLP